MRIAIGFLYLSSLMSIALAQEPTEAPGLPVQVRALTVIANNLPEADRLRIVHAFQGRVYVPEELRERVRQNLRDLGYYESRVEAPEFTQEFETSHARSAEVSIKVSPGDQFRFGEIHFQGASVFPQELLRSLFPVETGSLFNATAVGKGLEQLMKLYRTNGYVDIGVIPRPEIDSALRTVAFTMDVDEGKLSYFGRLILVGVEPRAGVGKSLIAAWTHVEGKRYNSDLLAKWMTTNAPFLPKGETAPEQYVNAHRDPDTQRIDIQLQFP